MKVMSKVACIDLETTIYENDSTGRGSPHNPDNWIVYIGIQIEGDDTISTFHIEDKAEVCIEVGRAVEFLSRNNVYMLVGQNIKFDLLYLLQQPVFKNWYMNMDIKIWDTMLAEYLLSGQLTKFASLNFLTEKYEVGEVKDDRVKALWDSGVSTEMIDEKIIVPYLKEDVIKTFSIFWHQLEQFHAQEAITEAKSFDLCLTQMVALQATTIMEHHGMYFRAEDSLEYAHVTLINEEKVLKEKLLEIVNHYTPSEVFDEIGDYSDITPSLISVTLFGGNMSYVADRPVLDEDGNLYVYKTGKNVGKIKTRKTKITYHHDGIPFVKDKPKWIERHFTSLTKNKITKLYPTGVTVLKDLYDLLDGELYTHTDYSIQACKFIENVLRWRELEKDISTYYLPYAKLTCEHDGCIHHTLNHTATNTGRLSSSKPNLQNVTTFEE